MPIRWVSAAGAALGRLLRRFRREDGVASANIALAMPHLSADERRHIVDRVWENSARTFFEFIKIDHLDFKEQARIVGSEHVTAAINAGRPIVFISGHLGNWNVSMCAIRQFVSDSAAMYRKANNPLIEPAIRRIYQSFSPHMLTSQDDVRSILRQLRNGTTLALLSDQHNSSGVEVTFFGQKILAPSGAAFFAWRSGAALIPVSCRRGVRSDDPLSFEVTFEAPLPLPDASVARAEAITQLTQNYYSCLEKFIRQYPESWFWLHARFSKYSPPSPARNQ